MSHESVMRAAQLLVVGGTGPTPGWQALAAARLLAGALGTHGWEPAPFPSGSWAPVPLSGLGGHLIRPKLCVPVCVRTHHVRHVGLFCAATCVFPSLQSNRLLSGTQQQQQPGVGASEPCRA